MDLRSRVLTGVFWTGGARIVSQAWTWVITIVVIRLLAPSDYGLLAMATVFTAFFALLAEGGIAAALVRAPRLDDGMLRRAFGAIIVINCALFLLQAAAAPLAARLFGEERLAPIVTVLGLQYLVMIFTAIPSALLSRELDFKRASVMALLASICGSLISLMLAYAGYGVWALVISNVIVIVCQAIGVNMIRPCWRKPEFSLSGMRDLMQTGTHLTGSRVLWFIYSQADVVIAGRVLGKDLLGFYSVSLHVASLPVQRLSALLNQIAYPAFAAAQRNPHTVPVYMLKAIRLLSVLSFPVLWGISSVAPEIVALLLGGDKWASAVRPLQILPLIMPITLIGFFLNTAFQAIGHAKLAFTNALTACIILPIAFLAGVQWGLVGLSVAWVCGYLVVVLIHLARLLPNVQLTISEVASAAVKPAIAGAAMYAAVGLVRYMAHETVSTAWLAAMLVGAGALTYVAISLLINRGAVRELFGLLRARPS
jgi:teichuronic acid exporter